MHKQILACLILDPGDTGILEAQEYWRHGNIGGTGISPVPNLCTSQTGNDQNNGYQLKAVLNGSCGVRPPGTHLPKGFSPRNSDNRFRIAVRQQSQLIQGNRTLRTPPSCSSCPALSGNSRITRPRIPVTQILAEPLGRTPRWLHPWVRRVKPRGSL